MRVKKALVCAAAVAVAALSLSGCMRMEADVYVSSDATVEKVGLVVGVDKAALNSFASLAASSPSSSQGASPAPSASAASLESFKEMVSSQAGSSDADLEKYCTYSEAAAEFLMTCSFDASQVPQMVQSTGEDLSFSKSGDSITAVVRTSDTDSSSQAAQMGVSSVMRLHFPGPVESVSGPGVSIDPQDGTVAVIDGMVGDGTDVTVTASASEATSFAAELLAVVGLAVLALIVVVAVVLARRHRRAVEDSPVVSDDVPSAPADALPWFVPADAPGDHVPPAVELDGPSLQDGPDSGPEDSK